MLCNSWLAMAASGPDTLAVLAARQFLHSQVSTSCLYSVAFGSSFSPARCMQATSWAAVRWPSPLCLTCLAALRWTSSTCYQMMRWIGYLKLRWMPMLVSALVGIGLLVETGILQRLRLLQPPATSALTRSAVAVASAAQSRRSCAQVMIDFGTTRACEASGTNNVRTWLV